MTTQCPHCLGDIPAGARYCLHCSRITTEYQTCPQCAEPISRQALKCSYCGHTIPTREAIKIQSIKRSMTASRIGAFLSGSGLTSLFHPPFLSMAEGRIQLTKWTFFGMRVHLQEIRIDRVASVRYTKGIIWGGLLVETFGGAAEDISQGGFDQQLAREMADELKAIIAA